MLSQGNFALLEDGNRLRGPWNATRIAPDGHNSFHAGANGSGILPVRNVHAMVERAACSCEAAVNWEKLPTIFQPCLVFLKSLPSMLRTHRLRRLCEWSLSIGMALNCGIGTAEAQQKPQHMASLNL